MGVWEVFGSERTVGKPNIGGHGEESKILIR